jgi:hypothetical protein
LSAAGELGGATATAAPTSHASRVAAPQGVVLKHASGASPSRRSGPRPTGRTTSKQPCDWRRLSAAGELGGATAIAAPTNTDRGGAVHDGSETAQETRSANEECAAAVFFFLGGL